MDVDTNDYGYDQPASAYHAPASAAYYDQVNTIDGIIHLPTLLVIGEKLESKKVVDELKEIIEEDSQKSFRNDIRAVKFNAALAHHLDPSVENQERLEIFSEMLESSLANRMDGGNLVGADRDYLDNYIEENFGMDAIKIDTSEKLSFVNEESRLKKGYDFNEDYSITPIKLSYDEIIETSINELKRSEFKKPTEAGAERIKALEGLTENPNPQKLADMINEVGGLDYLINGPEGSLRGLKNEMEVSEKLLTEIRTAYSQKSDFTVDYFNDEPEKVLKSEDKVEKSFEPIELDHSFAYDQIDKVSAGKPIYAQQNKPKLSKGYSNTYW